MTPRALPVLEQPAAACCAPLGADELSDTDAVATASLFKALADPHRVRIVNGLATARGSVCVCDLVDPLGLSQPTVSFHMKKLVEAGLLVREQRGKWAYYSLNAAVVDRVRDVLHLDRRPEETP
ncbi:MAG TPA: metalloregulator ArsR/SmtB family transcription factor [Actinomycetota bacterium]|nr:metalloregulator ArsR/SmtB family transcription factor [Actinomycetota bacterium]